MTKLRQSPKKKQKQSKIVVTRVNASKTLGTSSSIDKIDWKVTAPVTIEELKSISEKNGYDLIKDTLNREYGKKIGHFKFIHRYNSNIIYRISTNPNNFRCFHEYIKELNKVVMSSFHDKLELYRIDLALDITKKSHNWCRYNIYFKGKQAAERYVDKGFEQGTRYYGRNDSIFKAYDRTKLKNYEDNPKHKHESRIELSIKGSKKLKKRSLRDQISFILSDDFKDFESVLLMPFKLKKIPVELTKLRLLEKQIIFKTLVKHNGINYAKSTFNKNRNFYRDIKKIATIQDEFTLNQIFKEGLHKYLELSDE